VGLRFDSPWFLLLLLPMIGYFIWSLQRNATLSGLRKHLTAAVRILIMIFLVCALAGMQWFIAIDRKAVIFVIDRSDSMSAQHELLAWMETAGESKRDKDDIGVVSVGLEAASERNPSLRDLAAFKLNSQVNQQFTNLSSGLQLAEHMIPEDASARIVLLSDGRENVGNMLQQGKLLRDKGIPVDVLTVPPAEQKDAAVKSLKVPERLYQGEQYVLEVDVNSTFAAAGELRIYEDNQEISNQPVHIERGNNRYALQGLAKDSGFHQYRAEIYVSEDSQSANNTGDAFSRVTGPPKVLVVEGKPESSHNIISVLDASLIPYDLIPPEMLSRELTGYTQYESILFNDVSATMLSGVQMEMIEQAVRDFGIGFMMIGGEDSFGLGGYFKTPIERALPVYMDLRGKREIPSLGLVLVIDKSGSMDGGKMELAKEAAIRTVELMREQDTVGIVAFDSSPWWVVEPQKLTDREAVIKDISSIQPDGGTEIYTALEAGYQKLLDVNAQRKHIILLTDGQSSTTQSYEQLTGLITGANMTLSSVAIGGGADQRLLEHIATLAKGRYYFTNDQSTVPAIFSREAVLISRTYIVDQPFVPTLGQGGDWRYMFQSSLPKINAYIATTAKETAEVVLMSPEPDPLLARWQYGSGKSVAWTSDLRGRWSGDWVAWEDFPDIFSEMIKWTFPQFHTSPFQINSRLDGNRAILEVKSHAADFQGELKAVITDGALKSSETVLTPTIPGEYEAEFDVSEPGVYLTKIEVYEPNDQNSIIGSVTGGFVIPYSPEYHISDVSADDKMQQLAEITGGRVLSLDEPEEVFKGEVVPKKRYYDMTHYLLAAALMLWIIDIAMRRLSIPWNRLFLKLGSGLNDTHKTAINISVERLKQRKQKMSGRFTGTVTGGFIKDEPMVRERSSQQVAEDQLRSKFKNENMLDDRIDNKNDEIENPQNNRLDRLLAAKKRRNR
jgi:Ca-activated chloride channel family protein